MSVGVQKCEREPDAGLRLNRGRFCLRIALLLVVLSDVYELKCWTKVCSKEIAVGAERMYYSLQENAKRARRGGSNRRT